MEFREKSIGEVRVLGLKGRMDATSSGEIEMQMNGLIDSGSKLLVVNFSDVDYVSSSGLRTMLSSLKKVKKAQGNMCLACMKPMVRQVFDMAGFTQLFEICDTEEDALDKSLM